jgi:small ligand-binding sensory domain FIST
MQFHSVLATGAELEAACRQAATAIHEGLGPGPIDLAMVFASPRYGASIDRLPVMLHEMLGARTLVGCSGAAVADGAQVLENRHALAVLAGRLPGAQVDAVAVGTGDLPDMDGPPSAWRELLPPCALPRRGFVVLCEPFHLDARALLAGLDFGFPGVPKVGGVASGSRHPEGHTLFFGRNTFRAGAVVVSFAGDVQLDAVVAQGCRPIGRPGRVTKADRNRLVAVDDRPARVFLEEQLSSLPQADQELVERSPLFLGIASDPFAKHQPAAGDFLIRNILGVDGNGDLVVADHLPIGRHVQLHLRDAASGVADLVDQLQRAKPAHAAAGVMFRCLGRDGPDHAQFTATAPGVPLAGLHCNGEIGSLGDVTHLHAYTAAFALLRPRRPGEAK